MNGPPLARLEWEVPSTGGAAVGFAVAHLGPAERARVYGLAAATPAALTRLTRALDAAWARHALVGAALLHRVREDVGPDRYPGWRWTRDLSVVLNVLGRARSGLLLPAVPLDLDPARLDAVLWTDDPRLVTLAGHATDLGKELP